MMTMFALENNWSLEITVFFSKQMPQMFVFRNRCFHRFLGGLAFFIKNDIDVLESMIIIGHGGIVKFEFLHLKIRHVYLC